jgi:hypothetical protein
MNFITAHPKTNVHPVKLHAKRPALHSSIKQNQNSFRPQI